MRSPKVRDARPFLAHHLRSRANARADANGASLHALARWVENLPAHDHRMARIEGTEALGYDDGSFTGGEASEQLIASYNTDGDSQRERWLDNFTEAVAQFWA